MSAGSEDTKIKYYFRRDFVTTASTSGGTITFAAQLPFGTQRFVEFNEKSWQIPLESQPFRYSLAAHGVGMADEWPIILLHPDFANNHGGHFEENMVICVESLIAEPGTESVKLETQALVTKNGIERLDTFPWETD